MRQATLKLMFSSKTDDWATPQDLFDRLSAQYGPFELDAAASAANAKCPAYFTATEGGLSQQWTSTVLTKSADLHTKTITVGNVTRVWLNPPYGRGIGAWVKKAYEESQAGAVVCCLLPARTCTAWFHDYCLPYGKIEFLRGRVKFGGAKTGAPFPSMVVVFGLKEAA